MKSLSDQLNEELIKWQKFYAEHGIYDEYDVPDDVINTLNRLNAKHNYGSSKNVVDKDCTGRPIQIGDVVLATEIPPGVRTKEGRNHFWYVVGMCKVGPIIYNPMYEVTSMKGPDLLVIRDPNAF